LDRRYSNSLRLLLKAVQKTGDLEGTKAVMAEMDRFAAEAGVPPSAAGDAVPRLREVQAKYTEEMNALTLRRSLRVVRLTELYDQALEKVQREKVAAGELEAATAVADERRRVSESRVYADAAAMVRDHEAQTAAEAERTAPAPRPGLTRRPDDAVRFGKHYYKVYREQLSWPDAKARCEALGGYLACVESAAENAFLSELADGARCWLGGSMDDDAWRWVSGEAFRYRAWAEDEGDNRGQPYLIIDEDGRWRDAFERHRFFYICEWDPFAHARD
jgi:hypothetical protein